MNANYSEFHHNIKLLLEKINFSHVWANQCTFSKSKLLHAVTVKLKYSYVTFWRECVFDDDRTHLPTGKSLGHIVLLRLHTVLITIYYLVVI